MEKINSIASLAEAIHKANSLLLAKAQKQVNVYLTLRNWVIGFYIVEYEHIGEDRADYGEQFFKKLAEKLRGQGIRGLSFTSLHLCKQFYLAYPQIVKAAAEQLQLPQEHVNSIVQSVTEQSLQAPLISAEKLINHLSFTHFVELIKAESALKRTFYELEAINNTWSVRQLARAMSSMLFERTGLAKKKFAVTDNDKHTPPLNPEDVFRNPYMLEFLGLQEKAEYSETDLEGAIISHLQTFLLEMGKGFCFEARQRRITFDNTHYKIDLVFYHRILKCHVLIDLKIGAFSHADAGQMNVYLNYFKDNELMEGDHPPVGIILCTGKK